MKICGDHSQGETPGPIPNPEAKALHGDGTALERVWESSASPLTLLMASSPRWSPSGFPGAHVISGVPRGVTPPGNLFYLFLGP